MKRGYIFALKPTPTQAQTLSQWVGATRFVYNLALEQRRDFWRQFKRTTGRHISWVSQSAEITQLRAEVDWIAAAPSVCLEQAVRDLDTAFAAFFAGRARYPTPRRKGENDSIRFKAREATVRVLNAKWSEVKLPKIGWLKFRRTRAPRGELRNVTVALRAGCWTVAFCRDVEFDAGAPRSATVGIDRGIAATVSLSTGEAFRIPASLAELGHRQRRAQKVLSRRKRGSRRYAAQRARVAKIRARAARIRRDWNHRLSTQIASRFGVVAVEDLKIANMTASAAGTVEEPGRNVRQKAGLNRSIFAQGWGQFATMLDYKLTERGGYLITVPAAYTSQTCAACGVVDARSRKSQAVFACVHCDHTDNADVNAAKEILRRSTAFMDVEGSHFGPAEASIMAAA